LRHLCSDQGCNQNSSGCLVDYQFYYAIAKGICNSFFFITTK